MWNAPVDTVQIEVPRRLLRAMHWRPLSLLVIALTGVSVSFCPLFLYWLGQSGANITDWRVLANLAIIYFVPGVYMSFGAPVLVRAWKRSEDSPSGGEDVTRRRVRSELLFWLLLVVIGLVIWAISGWFVK